MSAQERLIQEDSGEPFGDNRSLNNHPYPSWWPTIKFEGREGNLLEMLHGFPYLSFWAIEQGSFSKMPPIQDLMFFSPPSEALFKTFPEIERLEKIWIETSKTLDPYNWKKKPNWKDKIGDLASAFWDKNRTVWEAYLYKNCLSQMQFFGSTYPEYNNRIYNERSPFFKKSLGYCPGKWILMVNLSLLILIQKKIAKSGIAPFIDWKIQPREENLFPLLSEKSLLNFPICKWISTDDLYLVKNLITSFTGGQIIKKDYELNEKFIEDEKLHIVLCFRDFYENDGFAGLSESDVRTCASGGSLRLLYSLMVQRINSTKGSMIPLFLLDKQSSILNNKYANFVSSTDFLLFSVVALYCELKRQWGSKFNRLETKEGYLRASFGDGSREIGLVEKVLRIKREQAEAKRKLPEDRIERVEQQRSEMKEAWEQLKEEDITGPKIEPPLPMSDDKLKTSLESFRFQWRKTAMWKLFKIGQQDWPIILPNNFEKETYEFKVVEFMNQYPPRRIRIPSLTTESFLEFNRLSSGWEPGFAKQYLDYLVWVDLNVRAMNKEEYRLPGTQLKDKDGKYVTFKNEQGQDIQLLNTYPDIMLESEEVGKSGFSGSKIIPILFIPLHQAATFIWGDSWNEFLDAMGKKIWERVKEVLKEIILTAIKVVEEVAEAVDDLVPNLKYFLIMGIGAVGVLLLGVDFLDAKIKKLA